MEILTWNIRHGGSKKRQGSILHTLIGHNCDVILLTEYREEKGSWIRQELFNNGWSFQESSKPDPRTNGLLVVSKQPFIVRHSVYPPAAKHRWFELYFPLQNLDFLGVHVPNLNEPWGKRSFWETLNAYAALNSQKDSMIIGDFNTGLSIDAEGTPFALSRYMEDLIKLGWVDAWRLYNGQQKEFTWYSNKGNGFRLDYAFLSPSLISRLKSVRHSHTERERRYSDHSSLSITLQ